MADALRALPCVESDSVNVDFDKKEATFTVKKNKICQVDDLKKKVKDTGRGTVASIRAAT